jgi:hypothetical protein
MPRINSITHSSLNGRSLRRSVIDLGTTATRYYFGNNSANNVFVMDSAGDQTQQPFGFYGQGGTFWPVWYAHKPVNIFEIRYLGTTQASGNFGIRMGFYSETIDGLRNNSVSDHGALNTTGSQGNFYPDFYRASGVSVNNNVYTGEGWGTIPAGNYFTIPCWDHKYFRAYPNPTQQNFTNLDESGSPDITMLAECWYYNGFTEYGRNQDPVDFTYLLNRNNINPPGDWPEALGGDYSDSATPQFQPDYFYNSIDPNNNPRGEAFTPYVTLKYTVEP